MRYDGFIGGAYAVRSSTQATDTCVNLYLETAETPGTKNAAMLVGTPGLRRFCLLPAAGGVRGLYTTSAGRAFAVCGMALYELYAGGTAILRGSLASAAGPVSLADNGLDVILVDGTDAGYLLTLATNAYTAIASAGFYGGDAVVAVDGYFVLNRPGTEQFYISGLLDGTTYNPSEFASAEGRADPIRALITDHRELLVFGSKTTQPFFNSGALDFPFEPLQGTLIEQGIAGRYCVARCDNSTYWLGENERGNGIVWKLQGYTPVRVSTHAVEFALNGYARLDDAIAYSYVEEGHSFFVLTFPSGNATWVFDAATGVWHQRAGLDQTTGFWDQHPAQYHLFAFGLHLLGGEASGVLYDSALDCYTNDGAPLVRERTAPFLHADERLLYHSLFELDLQRGMGLDGGVIPGTTPQVLLQWSDTHGQTWSTEHWVSAGAQGEYRARALWRRLGRSRTRVYRIRIADPVPVALVAARLEVT